MRAKCANTISRIGSSKIQLVSFGDNQKQLLSRRMIAKKRDGSKWMCNDSRGDHKRANRTIGRGTRDTLSASRIASDRTS